MFLQDFIPKGNESHSILNATVFNIEIIGLEINESCSTIFLPATSCPNGTCKYIFEAVSTSNIHCLTLTGVDIKVLVINVIENGTMLEIAIGIIYYYANTIKPNKHKYMNKNTLFCIDCM